jgi:putative nucleotidyltransferase with HDIG domain
MAKVVLKDIIFSLSSALDLVGVDDLYHGKRVAYMAYETASIMSFGDEKLFDIFQIGLLHDVGVSSTKEHQKLVEIFYSGDSQDHCKIGANLTKSYKELEFMSEVILYHHTKWSELKANKNISLQDALIANLIFLVDRVDTLLAQHPEMTILTRAKSIQKAIVEKVDDFFASKIVEAFLKVSQTQSFWLNLESPYLNDFLDVTMKKIPTKKISFNRFANMAQLFSVIVDAKSRFTIEHSYCVALVAYELALDYGLSQKIAKKIKVAGLLHDIGKLRVPDSILNKPSKLTDDERDEIERHSFETYHILKHIRGIEDITMWAAYHHETIVEMQGYPFNISNNQLKIESRIISVADIFQSLVQKRPYRDSMPINKIETILDELTNKKHIDDSLVMLLERNIEKYYKLAQSEIKNENYIKK